MLSGARHGSFLLASPFVDFALRHDHAWARPAHAQGSPNIIWQKTISGSPGIIQALLSQDGQLIGVSTLTNLDSIYRASDGVLLWSKQSGDLNGQSTVAFTPDGTMFAISTGVQIDLYRRSDFSYVSSIIANNTITNEKVNCVDFSPDSSRVALGTDLGRVEIFFTSDGTEDTNYDGQFGGNLGRLQCFECTSRRVDR